MSALSRVWFCGGNFLEHVVGQILWRSLSALSTFLGPILVPRSKFTQANFVIEYTRDSLSEGRFLKVAF